MHASMWDDKMTRAYVYVYTYVYVRLQPLICSHLDPDCVRSHLLAAKTLDVSIHVRSTK